MSAELLDKTRKLSRLFKTTDSDNLSTSKALEILSDLLDAKVCITGLPDADFGDEEYLSGVKEALSAAYLNSFIATRENVRLDGFMPNEFSAIVPIAVYNHRFGTLIATKKQDIYFDIEDIAVMEYAAMLIGMEFYRAKSECENEDKRKRLLAQNALNTLSATEIQAVLAVFEELSDCEGLLVTSRIADKAGITRSVIINAIRKLESAGVVTCRSAGMKGTDIRVINEMIYEQIVIAKQK